MAKRKTVLEAREGRLQRRHRRVRKKVTGSAERPRLVVHRSLNNIQGQVIDDTRAATLVGISSLAPELRAAAGDSDKTAISRAAGRALAEQARARGITRVVFDRGGYLYHGRIKAFAEGAREGGLEF